MGNNMLRALMLRSAKVGCCTLAMMAVANAANADEASDKAVTLSLSYTADVIGAVDGGIERRGRFLDNLDIIIDADLEKAFGWRGATAHFDILNNSGEAPNDDIGTLQGVDNIEVSRQRLRLFEAWVEQAWDNASLRVGLYDLNSEFYANDAAGLLIAPAFGIGSEIAATGPNGPSIFPSTALAARYQYAWESDAYVRGALINADASVLGDPDGVDFSFDDGVLMIAEVGVDGARKIAGGVWRYSERQDDIRDSEQEIAQGAYIVFEQPLNDPEADRATTAFFRAGVSEGETTPFEGGWQAGLLVERVFASRPNSAFSIGLNQGLISDGYRQNLIDGGADMSDAEFQVEVTYSDEIFPRVTLQPDVQWIRRPGGDRAVEDALVVGLRVGVSL
jgi:porin